MGLLAGVAGAVVLTSFTSLEAQNRGGTGGVVCIDVVKIFDEYNRQKDLSEEMKQIQEDMRSEVETRQKKIESLQATLDAMDPSDPTITKKMREMLQMQIDFKNWSDLMQADMAREVGLWTRRIYEEIVSVAEEMAQRNGYSMVLYREAPALQGFDPEVLRDQIRMRKLIWCSDAVDITQTVLDQLNDRYDNEPKTQMLQITP
jgi:Skp family chaperone for outer membrane proteins